MTLAPGCGVPSLEKANLYVALGLGVVSLA